MQLLSTLAASAIFATTAVASLSNIFSPIPGYPLGNGLCLSDQQATFLVNTFASALENPNRSAANTSLQTLIGNSYSEQSDSINILAGYPLGSVSFAGKAAYIAGVINAPPVPTFETLQIFHDCNNIGWRWIINGLGKSVGEVKGINVLQVANVLTGQLTYDYVEFNSILWGEDIGWTCTPPPS